MEQYLGYCGVLIKNFKSFAESTTAKVKAAAFRAAALAGRPLEYLPNAALSKEELARELARRDKIKQGLIAIFTAVEPCLSYSLRGDQKTKQIKLVLEPRKCTHFYHYYLDEQFGLLHVRVQSWFPFSVDVCLNARGGWRGRWTLPALATLLRAHGLIRKVSGTHRYTLSQNGRRIITALLA